MERNAMLSKGLSMMQKSYALPALECKYLANEKDGSFSIISFGLPILDFTAQSRFSFGPYIEIFQMDGLLTVK